MLNLLKNIGSSWEQSRDGLYSDLEQIETVLNRRWGATFGTASVLGTAMGGTGTSTAFTKGSVIFAGTDGVYTENNAAFFWDNTNKFLILTPGNAPSNNVLEIRGSGGVLAFKDAANTIQHGFIGSLSSPVAAMVIGASGGEPLVLGQNGSTVNFGSYSANHPALQWDSTTLYAKVYNVASHYNFSAKEITANADGLGIITLGGLDADRSYGGLWLAQATPSFSNYAFLGHGGATNQTFINVNASGGGTGDIECRVDNNTRFAIGAKGVAVNFASNSAPTQPFEVLNAAKAATLFNITDAGLVAVANNLTVGTTITKYNNITTAGKGMPAIYSEAITATQTANATILTYTPPAAAGRYVVSGVITTTSATNTGTVQLTLDYKDSQGTAHTADILPLTDAAGAIATTKTGASKEFHATPWCFTIDSSATNIVVKVVITGAVSYTASAHIEQVA